MKGFSLIELLIAISILALVSVASYQGYASFAASQKDHAIVQNLDTFIHSLDAEVANDVISSYVLTFNSGSLGVVATTNSYRLTTPLLLNSFDWVALSGSIDMSSLSGNPWFRSIVDGKISGTTVGSGGVSAVGFAFPLGTHDRFELVGFSGTSALNTFRFESYDAASLLAPIEIRPVLHFEDATLTGVLLKNFRSKKTLESTSGIPLESTKLVFTRQDRSFDYLISPHD